jgi:hypothetical protein
MISHLAFEESAQTQVAAILQNLQYTQYFTLLIMDAGTGSIVKSFKDLAGGPLRQIMQTSLRFISPTNIMSTFSLDRKWTFMIINPTLVSPLRFGWYALK